MTFLGFSLPICEVRWVGLCEWQIPLSPNCVALCCFYSALCVSLVGRGSVSALTAIVPSKVLLYIDVKAFPLLCHWLGILLYKSSPVELFCNTHLFYAVNLVVFQDLIIDEPVLPFKSKI